MFEEGLEIIFEVNLGIVEVECFIGYVKVGVMCILMGV